MAGRGNPGKAKRKLGWKTAFRMKDVVRMMAANERRLEK